jgi:2-polyprenyl-6-methoxyphenol hydroxylase-like FAD-dependent oxidoreductase
MPDKTRNVQIPRQRLRQILLGKLESEGRRHNSCIVRWNHTFLSFRYVKGNQGKGESKGSRVRQSHVEILLGVDDKKMVFRASLLIGADGIFSKVRYYARVEPKRCLNRSKKDTEVLSHLSH